MKRLVLIVMMLAPLAMTAQQVVVSGVVVDQKTGDPLRQVSISAGHISVVTNEDGDFTLKLNDMPSAVNISHLGYKSQRLTLKDGKTEGLQIRLEPTTIQLREIVVQNYNPRELVNIAIDKIPENYSRVPELLKGFYRETAMKRKHYIYVAEGVEDMYKTPYDRGTTRDRVAMAVMMDLVKNREFLLNKEDLDNYDFSMGTTEYINDRQQYVVLMEPSLVTTYALYHGKLYIDAERLAFTRIELDLDMRDKDKATQTMLVKKPFGVRFKPRELSTVVDYRYDDGVTRISYLRNIFRFNCDWKRKLFSTSFTATPSIGGTIISSNLRSRLTRPSRDWCRGIGGIEH